MPSAKEAKSGLSSSLSPQRVQAPSAAPPLIISKDCQIAISL
ncbi:Hypothetical protein AJF4211_000560 [Avibacterium paragallinarum JF4211]|nr:Hypothetical protein AJF4211_000560 [Avibacterium paragallinarum JF4211]